jgi:hypothetical protein
VGAAFRSHQSERGGTGSARIVSLRTALGFESGALPDVLYQMTYRKDSIEDVHVTMDLLFRYIDYDGDAIRLLPQPSAEDTNEFRGPRAILQDARLVADALGLCTQAARQRSSCICGSDSRPRNSPAGSSTRSRVARRIACKSSRILDDLQIEASDPSSLSAASVGLLSRKGAVKAGALVNRPSA